MNKNREHDRQTYEDYEAALFRLAIHELAEEEGRQLQAVKAELQAQPEYQPSPAALESFNRELDVYLRQQQRKARRYRLPRTLNRAAVVVLAVFIVIGTAFTTVDAFRSQVMNLWLRIEPQFTVFRLREGDPSNGSDLIIDWTNAYVPTYIPEGYRLGSIAITERARELIFEHETAPMAYSELQGSSGPVIDTEDTEHMLTVDINGQSGTLIDKHGRITLVWEMDKRLFTIRGLIDRETAIKVARGVKFIK